MVEKMDDASAVHMMFSCLGLVLHWCHPHKLIATITNNHRWWHWQDNKTDYSRGCFSCTTAAWLDNQTLPTLPYMEANPTKISPNWIARYQHILLLKNRQNNLLFLNYKSVRECLCLTEAHTDGQPKDRHHLFDERCVKIQRTSRWK